MNEQAGEIQSETEVRDRMHDNQKEKMGEVHIRGLTKSFGTFEALHEMDLSIEAGEYCTLLGPSGCGKTTLLRMIAGHETPTTGTISIDGQSVLGVKSAHRVTAMMFQNYALFPHLSVLDNVSFALKMRGTSRQERHRAARQLLEKVGLEAFSERLPSQLSGGQQQRVALARALITDPKVLLLDEPLSALDEFLRLRMRGELRRIQSDLGITFVHVTHSQLEAIGVSDKVVVMDKGRIEQSASPHDIYTRPRNVHVARFIGGQNVLDARVLESANRMVELICPQERTKLRFLSDVALEKNAKVFASVRKDRISLVESARPTNDTMYVPGVIISVEYQGSYVTVTLDTAFEHEFVASIPDHDFFASGFEIGTSVFARFSTGDLLFLNGEVA